MCLSRHGPGEQHVADRREGRQAGVGAAETVGPLGAEGHEFYSSLEEESVGQVPSPALNNPH